MKERQTAKRKGPGEEEPAHFRWILNILIFYDCHVVRVEFMGGGGCRNTGM